MVRTAFTVSGIVHLLRPQVFEGSVPKALPRPRLLVYASGVAELACALGLARRARWAGPASTALLVAVFPANVQMALDARKGDNRLVKLATLARLPLQIPLIWAAWQANSQTDAGRARTAKGAIM